MIFSPIVSTYIPIEWWVSHWFPPALEVQIKFAPAPEPPRKIGPQAFPPEACRAASAWWLLMTSLFLSFVLKNIWIFWNGSSWIDHGEMKVKPTRRRLEPKWHVFFQCVFGTHDEDRLPAKEIHAQETGWWYDLSQAPEQKDKKQKKEKKEHKRHASALL